MTPMCALHHLNAAQEFFPPRRLTWLTETTKRMIECCMDGDCSVDCEKTVLCVCLHMGHKSLVHSTRV